MTKDLLEQYLNQGKSTREIAKLVGKSRSTVSYYIHKYKLQDKMQNKTFKEYGTPYHFNKIDSKEKAYTLGFILGDGCVHYNNELIVNVNLYDKEVVDFISKEIDSKVLTSTKVNIKKRIYPHAITSKKVVDILKFTGGRLKQDRHYPKVPKHLERYLLLGFFDAEGCITYGIRKDRNRLWHKISFTSQYRLLEGIQTMLLNNIGIATKIHPKTGDKCFVLEFANKKDVYKFITYLYKDDFYVLKRKYIKANALRLELEEIGEK